MRSLISDGGRCSSEQCLWKLDVPYSLSSPDSVASGEGLWGGSESIENIVKMLSATHAKHQPQIKSCSC